jgi:hypothetical protein
MLQVADEEADEQQQRGWFASTSGRDAQTAHSGTHKVMVRVPRQPVISDPLASRDGPVQGLAWFFDSFFRDDWGSIGNELLEAVGGQLQKVKGVRRVPPHRLRYDRPPDLFNVRLQRKAAI